MYLDRNKEISKERKEGYRIFGDSMRQMMTAVGKPYAEMKKRMNEIREKLNSGAETPHKQWLFAVIDRETGAGF